MPLKSPIPFLAKRLSTAVAGRLVSLERNIYGLRKVGPIAEQSLCPGCDQIIAIMSLCAWTVKLRCKAASSVDEALGHLNRILGTAKHPLILQQVRIKVKTLRSHVDMNR